MLLSKQVCRHSTNEISLQLLSHPVTMATSSSEKNWIFKFKGPPILKFQYPSISTYLYVLYKLLILITIKINLEKIEICCFIFSVTQIGFLPILFALFMLFL